MNSAPTPPAAGCFYGVGVGPGEPGLIPLVAWETLRRCEVIFLPRARSQAQSVAWRCLPAHDIPAGRLREVEFDMDPDRRGVAARYAALAGEIAHELAAGRDVAYLTLGDTLTYSTFGYTLAALRERLPGVRYRVFPGVTSYAALAAAAGFNLGEGKESVLILPCPEEPAVLRAAVEAHDVVVLMKIGRRLPVVLATLAAMGLTDHCVFGQHVGMPDEQIRTGLSGLTASGDDGASGYLATILIRRPPRPAGPTRPAGAPPSLLPSVPPEPADSP